MPRSWLIPLALLLPATLCAAGTPAPTLPPPPPPAPAACPAPVCAPPMKTECVPEPGKKTRTHTCYSCRCKTICLPFCSFKKGCGGCAAPACGDCGKPREVRVLIKKFRKEECPEVKCVPRKVPACEAGCPAPWPPAVTPPAAPARPADARPACPPAGGVLR